MITHTHTHTSCTQVPNASPTAASASSDMYGAAVLDACEQIKARMEPVASRGNHKSFAEVMLSISILCLEKWDDIIDSIVKHR